MDVRAHISKYQQEKKKEKQICLEVVVRCAEAALPSYNSITTTYTRCIENGKHQPKHVVQLQNERTSHHTHIAPARDHKVSETYRLIALSCIISLSDALVLLKNMHT